MKSLYVDRETWFHKVSPRLKLMLLMKFSFLLFLTRDYPLLGIAVIISSILLSQVGLRVREILQRLAPIFLTIIIIALFSFFFASADEAIVSLLRLTALTIIATTITATVSVSQFIDEVTWALYPLEKVGLVKANDIGLAVGLVVRFIPEIIQRYHSIKDAAQARGISLKLHQELIPLIISTLKDAEAIADAIDARGFRGQSSKEHS